MKTIGQTALKKIFSLFKNLQPFAARHVIVEVPVSANGVSELIDFPVTYDGYKAIGVTACVTTIRCYPVVLWVYGKGSTVSVTDDILRVQLRNISAYASTEHVQIKVLYVSDKYLSIKNLPTIKNY